ncbi:hypothetical protein FLK61_26430 [Paenalkalicoccus suaedae]|uniref:DUF4352 domain-containing protein n=1 Tax=Paenalkalicoccus suaedae TaxID=2592382 RepID=A0A859FAM5_9BACI|nr:hypothetical protein [Paenalkalicoccus suaedae]QKS70299.1 hypothetical protein FLK61_26430 [Paenalkalicoccus suaedae]
MTTFKYGLSSLLLLAVITACSQTDGENTEEEAQVAEAISIPAEGEVIATTEQDDFRVTLSSAKRVYVEGEELDITGALTYVGDKDEMEIVHATSLVYRSVIDHKRDFFESAERLTSQELTTLTPGESITNENFSGFGYGVGLTPQADRNLEEIRALYDEVGGYPAGTYTFTFIAEFFYESEEGQKEFKIPASIDIIIEPS